jgi:hypothetical protein
MNFIVLIALFFILSPAVLFRLPGNKYVSALSHGLLFAIVWYGLHTLKEGNRTKDSKPTVCTGIQNQLKDPKYQNPTDKKIIGQKKHLEGQLAKNKC